MSSWPFGNPRFHLFSFSYSQFPTPPMFSFYTWSRLPLIEPSSSWTPQTPPSYTSPIIKSLKYLPVFATIHISFLIHCSSQSHMAPTPNTLLLLDNLTVIYMPLKAITHLHYAWAPVAFVLVAHCTLPYPNFHPSYLSTCFLVSFSVCPT